MISAEGYGYVTGSVESRSRSRSSSCSCKFFRPSHPFTIIIFWLVLWNLLWLSIQLGMSSSQLVRSPSFFRGVGLNHQAVLVGLNPPKVTTPKILNPVLGWNRLDLNIDHLCRETTGFHWICIICFSRFTPIIRGQATSGHPVPVRPVEVHLRKFFMWVFWRQLRPATCWKGGGFHKGCTPIDGWIIMEIPVKMMKFMIWGWTSGKKTGETRGKQGKMEKTCMHSPHSEA